MSFPRYPAYKDSGVEWLGELPEHWEVKRLKKNLRLLTEKTDRRANPVALENIEGWSGRFIPTDTEFEGEGIAFEKGDILFGKLRPYLAKALLAEVYGEAVGDFHVMRPQPGVHARFVHYEILSHSFIDIVDGSTFGSKMPRVSWEFFGSMELPTPPYVEQTAIATFLDHETAKIDALAAEQEQLIELLKEKRQAVISHAVTKGLDRSVPMKDSGVDWLGEVPAHWDVSPLKYLARIGNGSTPNRDKPDYWADEGFPWLNSSVVNQSEVSAAERFVTASALKECHLPIIEPPAVLIGITGQGKTRGMAAPLTFTATVNQHLAYVKPDQERLGVDFLLRALGAAYEHLRTESEGVGSTKGAITCGQLGAWSIPLPEIAEQSKIVAFLCDELGKLDALTEEAERGIACLHERRIALISAAVTGQIDVRGWAPSETAD